MTEIRNLVANSHALITHRRMPRASAIQFDERVRRLVTGLREALADGTANEERLETLADALLRGAAAVGGRDEGLSAIDGIVLMDEALARYAAEFDHPGWKAPRGD